MRKLVLWVVTGIVKRRHAHICREVAKGPYQMGQGHEIVNPYWTEDARRDAALPWDKAPDFIIGTREDPYLMRWFLVPPHGMWPLGWLRKMFPKSKLARAVAEFFAINIYLHRFIRSDDDRALHDHPWANMSYILEGEYDEVVFIEDPKGTAHGWEYNVPPTKTLRRKEGQIVFRPAHRAHRIQLMARRLPGFNRVILTGEQPVWSLFITNRKVRSWGFWCPKGWRHWEKFVADTRADVFAKGQSRTGRGCE